MTSFLFNHCRYNFCEWKTVSFYLKMKFCHQWKRLPFRNLTYIVCNVNALFSSHTKKNFSKTTLFRCIYCIFFGVDKKYLYIYLLYRKTPIVIYKAGVFYYDCDKVTSFFSVSRFNYLCARMHKAPLLVSHFCFFYPKAPQC